MIRVLEFADVINRHDFIDSLVHYADPEKFEMSVCVRSEEHGIAVPEYSASTKYEVIAGTSRASVPIAAWKLARLMRQWRTDVVHAHHFDQAVIAWLATRMYPAAKLVIGRHYSDSLYRLSGKLKPRVFVGIEQMINMAAARIIVPSQMIFEILTVRQHVDPAKVDVVQYGFVPEKYSAVGGDEVERVRHELGMNGRFVVANLSRLHEEKGHRYLIEAAAMLRGRVQNLLVLLVGEGPERANIERRIAERGVQEHVKLTGWRTDAMAIMATADAVVQSTLQEAFSQAMIETLWMKKPLVMTDVSGARDVIRDGENGLLVPKGDAAALAGAIERLAVDPALGERISAAGREFVVEELVITKKIKGYERAFEKAAG